MVASTETLLSEQIDQTAEAWGLVNRSRYMNYAAIFKGPVTEFRHENESRPRAFSLKYDSILCWEGGSSSLP